MAAFKTAELKLEATMMPLSRKLQALATEGKKEQFGKAHSILPHPPVLRSLSVGTPFALEPNQAYVTDLLHQLSLGMDRTLRRAFAVGIENLWGEGANESWTAFFDREIELARSCSPSSRLPMGLHGKLTGQEESAVSDVFCVAALLALQQLHRTIGGRTACAAWLAPLRPLINIIFQYGTFRQIIRGAVTDAEAQQAQQLAESIVEGLAAITPRPAKRGKKASLASDCPSPPFFRAAHK